MRDDKDVFKFTVTFYVTDTDVKKVKNIFDTTGHAIADLIERGSHRYGGPYGKITRLEIHKEQFIVAPMKRDQHLEWAKYRATEAIDSMDDQDRDSYDKGLVTILDQFIKDLWIHKELQNHPAIDISIGLLMGGHLRSKQQLEHHITGFN